MLSRPVASSWPVPVAETRRARWLVGGTALLAVGALTAAIATDVHAHARERGELGRQVAAEQRLVSVRSELRFLNAATSAAVGHRAALETSIGSALSQLTTTDHALTGTNAVASVQGTAISTLQACLGGVQGAYEQIAANHNSQATQDISAVSGPCLSLAGGNAQGLVYPFDFPDPDVILVGSTYYAYATNAVAGNIQILDSTDLVHWSPVGNALPSLPAWAHPNATWAPGVIVVGGSILLYYAAEVNGPGGGDECISVASATQPAGPFVDSSTAPLECQTPLGGSLDPFPFVAGDGNLYLLWKSGSSGSADKIWGQELEPTGLGFAANTSPVALLGPDQSWQGGTVEAPDMVMSGGRYFLFYSGNDWSSADYAVGVATCSGPLGPCSDSATSQPILASGPGADGPGGESVFTDGGGSFWIAFHAYIPGAVGYPSSRDLFIRPLDLSGSTPVVEPPG
jgi:Glycosyl hydrolases family 43